MVIQPLSTRLIKPNFCFDLSHRRSTSVSLETRNLFTFLSVSSLILVPCAAGTYAKTGVEPCIPCAKGYYQPFEKQTYCLRCGGTKSTYGLGASTAAQCVGMYR